MLVFPYDSVASAADAASRTSYSSPPAQRFTSTIDYVNDYRARHGRTTLSFDDTLQHEAETRAREIVTHNLFSHQDLSGENFYQSLVNRSNRFTVACENLSLSYSAAAATPFAGWKHSETHNACMLDEKMSSFGYKIVQFDVQSNRPRYIAILILGS